MKKDIVFIDTFLMRLNSVTGALIKEWKKIATRMANAKRTTMTIALAEDGGGELGRNMTGRRKEYDRGSSVTVCPVMFGGGREKHRVSR